MFWFGIRLNWLPDVTWNEKLFAMLDELTRGNKVAKSMNWFFHIFFLSFFGICKEIGDKMGSA